ncbi:PIN domain-containing protein [Thermococcus sp.]|uniref:PIN domain-containing protein n=1 Tax=Thermococcus sp. TaxID=35749 RepID=UPI002621D9DC|nr:PIN domain-containing protein [Thermococcus sp.]
MLDSNVILEHLFGEHSISRLLALTEPHYNDIVYSEVLYLLIRNETGERPFTLSGALTPALRLFKVLNYSPTTKHTLWEAERLIQRYGLLPGDAIILANCMETGLDALLTWDSDLLKWGNKVSKCRITTPEEYLGGE